MENANILIVVDDDDFAAMIEAVLEGDNHTVDTAPDRTEGMEKFKAFKPDLLILDAMMAGWSDGFEMAKELKKNPEWLGVDAFLNKPAEPKVLLAEIRRLLS